MEMTVLLNAIDRSDQTTFAAGYSMQGEPDPARPVSKDLEVIILPIREPHFEIAAGDEHPEAPSFLRDYADIVRCMAPLAALMGGAKIIVQDGGRYQIVPSSLRFAPGQRVGSRLKYWLPYILISTALTPIRPNPSQMQRMANAPVDSFGRPITSLIGIEELLRQIGLYIAHEADRLWPGDNETPKWSDRVWQSLRADQDPSRIVSDLHPIEDTLDAFVEFALAYLRNSHLARLAVMDDCMFHTLEFARIVTGALGREIAEFGDQLWSDR